MKKILNILLFMGGFVLVASILITTSLTFSMGIEGAMLILLGSGMIVFSEREHTVHTA